MDSTKKAIEVLRSGGVIIYNTDTIPGLGCDATSETSAQKIMDIKNRPINKSFVVLVSSDRMLQNHVAEVPDLAWDLIDLSEKPTTIIYGKAKGLAKTVIADDGSVAIRMIKEGPLHQLIQNFGKPIVSTSANFSGEPSPVEISEIHPELTSKVDLIVDLPIKGTKQASAIIKLELNGEFKIIRK